MGVRHWRTTALLGTTAIIATVALAGCSSDSGDTESTSAKAPAGGAPGVGPAEDSAAGPAAPAEQGGAGPAAQAPNLNVDQRSIIYTGTITLRVENVSEAATKAITFATAAGGFVGGDKRSSSADTQEATIELRVPAAKFQSVVDQLARDLGKEESRGINTDDVTEETIDLDARISSQQARVDSGRKLLAQAKSLNDLIMLERELATREADLASLNGKKRKLADLAALSTITVVLLDPAAAAVVEDTKDDPAGFLTGLKGGWHALLASLAVLLTILGALLPWMIALGLPAWAAYYLFKRYSNRNPRSARTPALAAAGASFPSFPAHPQTQHPQHQPAQPPAPATPQSAPPANRPQSPPPAGPPPATPAD